MENCLIKKLIGAVNNDSLPYLNAIVVSNMTKGFSDSAYVAFNVPDGTVKIEVLSGNGGFSKKIGNDVVDNLTTVEISNTSNVIIYPSSPSDNNPLKIKMLGLDVITSLQVTYPYIFNIDTLSQCGNLTTLTLSANCEGKMRDLADIPSLTSLNVRNANVSYPWKPEGYIDDYYDALFEKGKIGTYTLLVGSGFTTIPHSNKFPTASYGTYTVTVTSEGWSAVFAA